MMKWSMVFLVTSVLFSPASAASVVITVNPDGSGDFTDLQAALDVAPDGAVVLIQGGSYTGPRSGSWREGVTVPRAVTLVGDPGFSRPLIFSEAGNGLMVEATGDVSLKGLDIYGAVIWCGNAALSVAPGLSRLFVDSCEVVGTEGINRYCFNGKHGVIGYDVDIFIRRCTIRGGNGAGAVGTQGEIFGGDGGDGIRSSGRVVLYESEITGGDGGDGLDTQQDGSNGDAGNGIVAAQAALVGSASTEGVPGSGSAYGGEVGSSYPLSTRVLRANLSVTGTEEIGGVTTITSRNRPAGSLVAFYSRDGSSLFGPLFRDPALLANPSGLLLGIVVSNGAGEASIDLSIPDENVLLGLTLFIWAQDPSMVGETAFMMGTHG